MQETSALARAVAMVTDLRARCPWDRAQTRETLRPYLVEELLELDHALGTGDPAAIREEVSDMLLHLAWQLVIATEREEFSPDDVADDLEHKMKRRHPHLFDLGPKEPWERIKQREQRTERGVLDGLPLTLPDLLMAFRLQERAASVGFDWPDAAGPLDKVREELAEVTQCASAPPGDGEGEGEAWRDRLWDEMGDLLFSVVNLARKLGVPPGPALDRANRKFSGRFRGVERLARERELELHRMTLAEMDLLWDEVKRTPLPVRA